MDNKVSSMETKLNNLEHSREFDSKTIDDMQGRQREIEKMLKDMKKLEDEQKERLIDLQCRQMRDNLIFYNINDERDESDQLCTDKLLDLFENDLKIENARAVRMDRAHRLGRYNPSKTRPIIAKFCFYQEREIVRKAAKNLEGSQYSISQQYPKEIMERRRALVPTLKRLKAEGKRANISVDKLYVEGRLYKGELIQPRPQQNGAQGRFREQGQGRGHGQGDGRDQGQGRYQALQQEHILNRGQGQMGDQEGQGQAPGDD